MRASSAALGCRRSLGCWVAKWKEICKHVMQCVTRKYCMRGAEAQQRAEQVLGRGNPAQRTILRGMGAARLGGVRASLRWPESQPHVRLLIEPRPGSLPTSSYSCIYMVYIHRVYVHDVGAYYDVCIVVPIGILHKPGLGARHAISILFHVHPIRKTQGTGASVTSHELCQAVALSCRWNGTFCRRIVFGF